MIRTARSRGGIVTALALGSALALTGCATDATPEGGDGGSDKTVRIGYIGPLSGGSASLGIPSKNAIDLAVADLNESGDLGFTLELVAVDDEADAAKSATAAQRMVTEDGVVLVIGGPNSAPVKANNAIITGAGVPNVISIAQSDALIDPANPGYDLTYRVTENNSYDVGAIVSLFIAGEYDNMPVVTHSGSAEREQYGDHLGIYVTEVTWFPARPMWFLLWSGVFHRFPNLKFCATEGGCWWLPQLLWSWDRLWMGQKGAEKLGKGAFTGKVEMLPSEIVDRNCFTGLANVKRRELGMRYEIGIDNMLWGTDFPHPEGTWPATMKALQTTFFDIPIDETRRMLGLSAAEVFGFDLEKLAPIAAKIGPTPTDLGQLGEGRTAQDLVDRWAPVKQVGRHWLTGHDFPIYPI